MFHSETLGYVTGGIRPPGRVRGGAVYRVEWSDGGLVWVGGDFPGSGSRDYFIFMGVYAGGRCTALKRGGFFCVVLSSQAKGNNAPYNGADPSIIGVFFSSIGVLACKYLSFFNADISSATRGMGNVILRGILGTL